MELFRKRKPSRKYYYKFLTVLKRTILLKILFGLYLIAHYPICLTRHANDTLSFVFVFI